jgi:predicted O-methyltransferase YrrM
MLNKVRNINCPDSLRDRIIFGGLRLIPKRLARHLLFLLRSYPALADSWGYHIRPIHYYEPLPDFGQIDAAAAARRRLTTAIDFNAEGQLTLLDQLSSFQPELEALASSPPGERFDFNNDYFAGLDAAIYYALLRYLKPARVIEVGAGYSTRIADRALRRNLAENHPGKLVCIEPYPEPRLTAASVDMELIEQRVEEVDTTLFTGLEANDVLFIDSSHTVKYGSDVCHLFLEVLPVIKPGVWVHIHDIFFPCDYPADWLINKRLAFNEQYLLEALLSFNRSFTVQAANHWLSADHPAKAANVCPSHLLSAAKPPAASFWMRREARANLE